MKARNTTLWVAQHYVLSCVHVTKVTGVRYLSSTKINNRKKKCINKQLKHLMYFPHLSALKSYFAVIYGYATVSLRAYQLYYYCRVLHAGQGGRENG